MKDYKMKTSKVMDNDLIDVKTIDDTKSFQNYLKSRASIGIEGWGSSVAASFSAESNI